MALLQAKNRVESVWTHLNPSASIVADDHCAYDDKHLTMALLQLPAEAEPTAFKVKKDYGARFWKNEGAPERALPCFHYVLHIGTDSIATRQLEVRLLRYSCHYHLSV